MADPRDLAKLHEEAVSAAYNAWMQATLAQVVRQSYGVDQHQEAVERAKGVDQHQEAVERAKGVLDAAIRAYLAHVAAAGWKLTPREADQAMVKAGLDAIRDSRNIWQAQHTAAPALPPGEDDPPS
jgi:hypothetical protein